MEISFKSDDEVGMGDKAQVTIENEEREEDGNTFTLCRRIT